MSRLTARVSWLLLLGSFSNSLASAAIPLNDWIHFETRVAGERMLKNISPAGTVPGTVIASPSRQSPDYFYHWTRDAGLVMDQVTELYANAGGDRRAALLRHIRDFVFLSRRQQQASSAEGLGEPRFRVDGSADNLPWARPQYDGPALRSLTLIRLLSKLPLGTPSSEEAVVRSEALKTIRVDLAFVARYWRTPCYDLWEEQRGLHFYTQSVQYAALLAGSGLFGSMGETAVARNLQAEARKLELELEKYWDEKRGTLAASRELEGRPGYKADGLDSAVILAALHAGVDRGILAFAGDRLLSTASALESAFFDGYAINREAKTLAIGRFTDDTYFGGNPWYLTTAAFAELHYRVADTIEKKGGITVTKKNAVFLGLVAKPGTKIYGASHKGRSLLAALRRKGDRFLATIRRYAGSQGELSEQFDRDAGVPLSAHDLTWSYASFLAAARQRPTGN